MVGFDLLELKDAETQALRFCQLSPEERRQLWGGLLFSRDRRGGTPSRPWTGAWGSSLKLWVPPGEDALFPLMVYVKVRTAHVFPLTEGHEAPPGLGCEVWGRCLLTNFFLLFIYFWLLYIFWVFVAARGLSLVVANGGYSSLQCAGFSLPWLLLLRSTGSRRMGSAVVARRL